jgi:Fe-Mn family superoxide dismutase
MAFELPALPYATNALEPHIDARTMEIHHTMHHQAYVTNLNNAIAGSPAENLSIEEICKNISKYPVAVRNNGGGHYNHTLFWNIMAPNAGGLPSGDLANAIDKQFGNFEEFKKLTPSSSSAEFFNLQKEVGQTTSITEANSDIRLAETDLDTNDDAVII